MMIITKIQQQSKKSDRYSIYIDDEFRLGISQEVLIQFALYKGQELTEAQLADLEAAENDQQVYQKALNYLSYGIRSVKEMREYLAKQRFKVSNPEEVIEEKIQRLVDQGYLNDTEYAKSYVRTAANLSAKGPLVITQTLKQKGINEARILTALAEYPIDLQSKNVANLADKFIKAKHQLAPKMLRNRLYQHLIQKGFTRDLVRDYLNTQLFEQAEANQDDNLHREAVKILRKYQRKYSGYELKQRLSQNLLGKGFDYDLIQNWVAEHIDTSTD